MPIGRLASAVFIAALAACPLPVRAAATPEPAASGAAQPAPLGSSAPATPSSTPAATPTASPPPGTLRLGIDAHVTFISSGSSGPGVVAPEAPGFIAGSPLSPLTPYDTWSSAPLLSGNAAESALMVRPTYFGRAFDLGVVAAAGLVRGSITNASYWGEPLLPALNPHLGSQMLGYRIVFPTHAGGDDGTGAVASIVSGRLASKDGNVALRAGYFDLAIGDGFAFVQPSVPNVAPAIAIVTPESLGDGVPQLDAWTPSSNVLPLHGVDLVAKRGLATLEVSDAALPSLPGTAARIGGLFAAIDHGEGTRYSLDAVRVVTGGDLVATTVLSGGGGTVPPGSPYPPGIVPSPQGPLPSTFIGGQRQTILGARAAFHAAPRLDALVEAGRSTYDATYVAAPGTAKPGSYLHGGVTRTFGGANAGIDYYRNDAYYATALLPYGAPENVWSVAWSWPGQWLKSNYQLINDFPVNVDRQGYRVHYTLKTPALDVRGIYANFGEIDPITYANAVRTGFVDGFFLPQANDAATLGRQHQYGLYVAWHPPVGDLSLDYVEDTMRRPAVAAHPEDNVGYDTPEYALTFTRHVTPSLLASIGYSRYAMRGSFGSGATNIDFQQRTGIAGLQWSYAPRATLLASVRRTAFAGIPAAPGGASPNFTNTIVTIEQRFSVR